MTLLTADNLSVSIGSVNVCEELDFGMDAGDCWAMLGRNGVGKTTLIHTLAGLYPATEGELQLQRTPLAQMGRGRIAQQLGVLFQDSGELFPGTVLETALMGRHPHLGAWQWESSEDIETAMRALRDMGLESLHGRNIQQLSGGERRRLGIATILAQDPDLYLLDEPVNHLDLHYQVRILEHFRQLASQGRKAILMSLHDINLATRFCNKVMLMFGDGEILSGNTDELVTADNLARLYRHPVIQVEQDGTPYYLPG